MRIGFAALGMSALLLALGWGTENMRRVPPDSQALVLRFGRPVGVWPSGLVMALPPPLARVVLLPGAARELVLKVPAPPAPEGSIDDAPGAAPDAGLYLTGDGGAVLLDAAVTWRVADAALYGVARDNVPAALRHVFRGAAVAVAAARPLDDFPAMRPGGAADPAAQETRRALGGDVAAAMNARLAALARAGAGLGVEVISAEVTARRPSSPRPNADAPPDAPPQAEQGLAAARADAARTRAQAEQARDALLSVAHARAAERLSAARASTAVIAALGPRAAPGLLDQLYRDRIGPILAQAGSINAVDAKSVSRLILPGAQ